MKDVKQESNKAKTKSPKPTLNSKKARSVKRKKSYKEDLEPDDHDDEIRMTGSRNPVVVYDEDFDDKLTSDEDHVTVENKGNCTMIKEASAKLLEKCEGLKSVYGEERCDDKYATIFHCTIHTSFHVKQRRWEGLRTLKELSRNLPTLVMRHLKQNGPNSNLTIELYC